jgi:dTDP-glucose 4,6-dehydratase
MKMTVCVIGSNSFSGAHFVRHALRQGADVLGISRSDQPHAAFLPYRWEAAHDDDPGRFRFQKGDLNHDLDAIETAIRDHESSYVVNFAAQSMVAESWQHPDHWYQTNVVANVLLHDRLRKMPFVEKYVHISTPEVYGNCDGVVDESQAFNPSTPYAASRAACDLHLMTFYKNYDFPVVFTRAANVYGPGQQLYRIIPRAVLFAKMGRPLPLHGGGHSVRSFIHIDDVADGTWRVMVQAAPPSVFHFSTTRFISIRDLVAMIAQRLDIAFEDLAEVADDRPGKDHAYQLDSAKAMQQLKWAPAIDLEHGIEDTVSWADRFYDDLKEQPMSYEHKP